MNNNRKLSVVKTVHTIIWVFYNLVVAYMLYAAIAGKIDFWFALCWGFVLLEGLVLLLFRFTCPLSLVARRYTDNPADNFDIFLPNWLARHTKRIYTAIIIAILVLTIYQLLR
jgi:hypothetical protein